MAFLLKNQTKQTTNCFASPGNKRREINDRASGWVLQVGLIVPSIKMQHGKVSLRAVDGFLCLKHGLLASSRDIKCAVLFLENEIVYPGGKTAAEHVKIC